MNTIISRPEIKNGFKNALVSVSNKTGLVEFLKPLVAQGLRVVSTGGTAEHLVKNGIQVSHVSEQTGFPEVMDGRVRTLHPYIHMPLLARQSVQEDMTLLGQHKLEPFDLVIVNLYPFVEMKKKNLSEEELIEYIDIGGPTLLRAAAKNYSTITVVTDPSDYNWISSQGGTSLENRKALAAKVFSHVSAYDSIIATTLNESRFPNPLCIGGESVLQLRYGENPQQSAVWYKQIGQAGLHDAEILQGKALSYNNILDLDAAVQVLKDFQQPTMVAVKHNNPCGVGSDRGTLTALEKAIKADPVSIFGGVCAVNFELEAAHVERLSSIFLECVIAPSVSSSARDLLMTKKNLRVLQWPGMISYMSESEFKSVAGGFLVQTKDTVSGWSEGWKVIGEVPDAQIKEDLVFAWKVVKGLKSNAIAIASDKMTLGLGMGQVNRVEAVMHAIERMKSHHKSQKGVVLASDAFFPFADSIEKISAAGIKWVIQPGGSIKDEEVVERSRQLNVNLIMTGERHFKH